METALKILSDEHQNILKVIEAILQECDSLQAGNTINQDFFKKALNFVKGYADKFHHAKEEDILFVELNKEETQMHCNPTQQMLHEHGLGRNFIKKLEEGINENNKEKIIKNAKEYAQLLQDHIFKEDNILYPMADQALDQNIKNEMFEKFKQIEQKLTKETEIHLSFLKELKK